MDKKLIMKLFKKSANSNDSSSSVIVVTHNTCSVNGGYSYDKMGVISFNSGFCVCYLNLYKLGFWLNSGAIVKTKVSWLAGLLSSYDCKLK